VKYFTKKAFNFRATREFLKFLQKNDIKLVRSGKNIEKAHPEIKEFLDEFAGTPASFLEPEIAGAKGGLIFINRGIPSPIRASFHEGGHGIDVLNRGRIALTKLRSKNLVDRKFFNDQLSETLIPEIRASLNSIRQWGHLASPEEIKPYLREMDTGLKSYKIGKAFGTLSNASLSQFVNEKHDREITKLLMSDKSEKWKKLVQKQQDAFKTDSFIVEALKELHKKVNLQTQEGIDEYVSAAHSILRKARKMSPYHQELFNEFNNLPLMRFKFMDRFDDIMKLRGKKVLKEV